MQIETQDANGLSVSAIRIADDTVEKCPNVSVCYMPQASLYALIQQDEADATPDIILLTPSMASQLLNIITDSELTTTAEGKVYAQ